MTEPRQRYWWWEEYHCGCVKEYSFKRECVGYCPVHGENRINLYKVALEAGQTEEQDNDLENG